MSMKNIDLSQEQIGTVFYTRNYSEARIIRCIGRDLYLLEIDVIVSFADTITGVYNKRGKILKCDMRKSHPLDLKEKPLSLF